MRRPAIVNIHPVVMTKYQWENRPFKTPFYVNVKNEGIIYSTLFSKRQSGDYDDFFYCDAELANELKKQAESTS